MTERGADPQNAGTYIFLWKDLVSMCLVNVFVFALKQLYYNKNCFHDSKWHHLLVCDHSYIFLLLLYTVKEGA